MKPVLLNLFSALSILLLIAVGQPCAQTPQRDNRPRTTSISGRVTIGGAPAVNALVMVAEVDPRATREWPDRMFVSQSQQRAFNKVRTDGDGRYRVTGLTEGAYMIRALSKAYVRSKNSSDFDSFRTVTLDEGESRDGVDIALVRGGVITGRVMNAEGRPLIDGYLQLMPLDENGKPKENFDFSDGWMMRADDRGVYRIYGLSEGRYLISVVGGGHGRANRSYPKTFYPDTTDQNQAKTIEVKEGAEITNIDIKVGLGKDTYVAIGRVIDAETGQPLPQVSVTCMEAPDKDNERIRMARSATTDDAGRFRVTGLPSGRYELYLESRSFPFPEGNIEHYSEKTSFEVSDSDVSDLVIKAIRGSTISGVLVIEGGNDPAIKSKLRQMAIGLSVAVKRESAGDGGAYEGRGHVRAMTANDGSFRLSGAPPGFGFFHVWSDQGAAFRIKRIERDGAEIKSGFEIRHSEQITGVRVVLGYGDGTIRGQVEIPGGKLPEGWRITIYAIPIRATTGDDGYPAFQSGSGHAEADEKGRFVIESLIAGEYELRLNAMVRVSQDEWNNAPGSSEVKQRVTVNSGAVTAVKLTIDPARKQQENRQ